MLKAHRDFVESELRKLIPEGSFASYIVESLAMELASTIEAIAADQPDAEWSVSPAEGLFALLDDGWTLEDDCFHWTDGIVRDDNEQEIPLNVVRHLTASEQMAAFGLSILAEDQLCEFDLSEVSEEEALSIAELSEWRTGVVLEAYHALVLAQKLQRSYCSDTGKLSHTKIVNFSALGAAGARKRHAPLAELKKWAVALYREKEYQSANAAAYQLAEKIIDHGREIGASLLPSNAQRTIAEWFRKSA